MSTDAKRKPRPKPTSKSPFLPGSPYDRVAAVKANPNQQTQLPRPAKTKTASFADPDSADGLEMLCAADHPAEPVEWLWPGRIPIGKVTLVAGDPGLGKSVLALDVAARLTRGAAWPQPNDEITNDEARTSREPISVIRHSEIRHSTPGSVLILPAAQPTPSAPSRPVSAPPNSPQKTGNELLDLVLDSLRQPRTDQVQCPPAPVPNLSGAPP